MQNAKVRDGILDRHRRDPCRGIRNMEKEHSAYCQSALRITIL